MKYTSSLPRQLRTAPRSSARGHQQVHGAGRLRAGGGERRSGLRAGLRAGPGSPPVPGGAPARCHSASARKRSCRLKLPSPITQGVGFTGRGPRESKLRRKHFGAEEIQGVSQSSENSAIRNVFYSHVKSFLAKGKKKILYQILPSLAD